MDKKGFTIIELLVVVVVIGLLAMVALPIYGRYITYARSAEAYQVLTGIIGYVRSYYRAHNGKWPSEDCDTETSNGEWIDEIVGNTTKYFNFYYVADPRGNVYVSVVGRTQPFSATDTLRYYFVTNTWEGTGYLKDIIPN